MRIVTIVALRIIGSSNIAEREDIELRLTTITCRIYTQQDRPCEDNAYEASAHSDLQVAQKEIAI